jgi:predicted ribosome quality control (RQC) complex YloA/Tae2 family protein
MNEVLLQSVVDELSTVLRGRMFGKIFQLSKQSLAIDFRSGDGRYLYINLDSSDPRLFLISRKLKEIEKQSIHLSPFSLALRKQLGGAVLAEVVRDADDRIVRFSFESEDAAGKDVRRSMVVQLTGRSANLLVLDDNGFIIDTLRQTKGEGQQVGEKYLAPVAHEGIKRPSFAQDDVVMRAPSGSVSDELDQHYKQLDAVKAFEALATAKLHRLNSDLAKRIKLKKNLEKDLREHGDADEHKRVGEILLANVTTAERRGAVVAVTDYFQDSAPIIEIPIDQTLSIQDEAARRFDKYTKAKRAAKEIALRMEQLTIEIYDLEDKIEDLKEIVSSRDADGLAGFDEGKKPSTRNVEPSRRAQGPPGVRAYRSSDGFEVLVGRNASDNDRLTFRIAGPHDLWFHSADYPGSHVVVRNPKRAAIPQRTVIEAAQMAAFFSQAKADSKVNVHYAERKFLSKPKGSAAGLVRLSSFKTLLVQPGECLERI